MICTDSIVEETADDVGAGRPVATAADPVGTVAGLLQAH